MYHKLNYQNNKPYETYSYIMLIIDKSIKIASIFYMNLLPQLLHL